VYGRHVTARTNISSGSPFEPVLGYCRAVCVGNSVSVSGTAPAWPDGSLDPDPGVQATRALEIIGGALAEAGATFADVVRTRVYLVDANDFDAVAAAHGAVFAHIRPANTTVVVAALLNAGWRVEIEADAIIGASKES
jgi:enamine deaminase RidA (YjgF/YER057c/UK114 family)